MKEFANDKTSNPPTQTRTDADPAKAKAASARKGPQSQAPDLLSAARAGEPWAIRMLQSAGNGAIDAALAPDEEPKSLGTLAQVNPVAAAKVARSTGKEVGDVAVKVEPGLKESGERGVAREGQEIGVGSESAAGEVRLMAHEAAHIVQQRGGAQGEVEARPGEGVKQEPGAVPAQEAASGEQGSAGGGPDASGGVDAEQEVVAAEEKLVAGEAVGLQASGARELFEELNAVSVGATVNGGAEGALESQPELEKAILDTARERALQTTAMGWIASIVGAPSATIDEDFVRATMKWQEANGLEPSGVLDEKTLDVMAPDLLAESGMGAGAGAWYKENGATLFKQTGKLAEAPQDNGPEPENPKTQPVAVILDALDLEAADAFTNLSDIDSYHRGKKLEVTDKFLERALLWQIEVKLGLDLDAKLGPSSLVYLGLDPGTKFKGKENYSIWNSDNLESGEVDDVTQEAASEKTFMGGVVNTITLGGKDKRSGDITGDDGIAFGIAHFTHPTDLLDFVEFVARSSKKPDDGQQDSADSQPSGSQILEEHFGSSEIEALKTELLLDKTWPKLNNIYLAALSEAGKTDALIGFFRDEAVKRLQIEHLRGDAVADISTYRGGFEEGGILTVGSAALIACLGNSSSHRLADVEGKNLEAKQLNAGELYLDGGGESPGYMKVAKLVWEKQFGKKGGTIKTYYSPEEWTRLAEKLEKDGEITFNERDKAIEAKGPQHRLRRLLNVLNNFGSKWDKTYTDTKGSL